MRPINWRRALIEIWGEIEMFNDYIEVPYIEVKQPIGSFYLTRLSWQDLLEIAEADIRKIEAENKQNNSFDSYLGIQREVAEVRVKEIAEYVTTFDATFPTSIILSISSKEYSSNGKKIMLQNYDDLDSVESYNEVVNLDITPSVLRIRRSKAIANVLDGQHRIEGLKRAYKNAGLLFDDVSDFELNVTIFVDLDIDDQAQIFSVINKAQTKVNKSLVYDLYEYSKSRSPQKTAHDIVRLLNRMDDSPFYKKIKILGKAVDKGVETIAQATFVELILGCISQNPMLDRDNLKKNKKLSKDYDKNKYVFRGYFIDGKDELILKVLWNYFSAVKIVWPNSWDEVGSGNILNKSTGLISLMRLLRLIYVKCSFDANVGVEKYTNLLRLTGLKDDQFIVDNYIPGSSGHSKLFNDLKKCIFDTNNVKDL